MAGRGGYQPPAKPAPVSGPGALSQRTDGGPGQPVRDMPDAKYGENRDFRAQQAGAPMASGPPRLPVLGLDEPSQRPDEPITAGVDIGPGPGSEVLAPAGAAPMRVSDVIFALAASDLSGVMADLGNEALQRGL